MSEKYESAKLPETPEEAEGMALLREQFAEEARRMDKHGTAKEFDLTALLLREYAKDLTEGAKEARFWWRGLPEEKK